MLRQTKAPVPRLPVRNRRWTRSKLNSKWTPVVSRRASKSVSSFGDQRSHALPTVRQAANLEEDKKDAAAQLIRNISEEPHPLKANNRAKIDEELEELQNMDDEQQALLSEAGVKRGRFEKKGYHRSSSSGATTPTFSREDDDEGESVSQMLKGQQGKAEALVRAAKIKADAALETAKMDQEIKRLEHENRAKEIDNRRIELEQGKEVEMARMKQANEVELARIRQMDQVLQLLLARPGLAANGPGPVFNGPTATEQ